MPTTELYLIRHAESEMNTQAHLVSGRSNETPLTPKGIEQAKQVGRYLLTRGIIPTKVYASPAVRTVQTATYALEEMKSSLSPVIDDALQELHQGDWVGQLRDEIYSDVVLEDISRLGKDFKAPNGESMNEVGARMLSWVESNITDDGNLDNPQRVFVFSHGVAIRCLASALHEWTQDETYQAITDNTSISLFTQHDGLWQLEYLGQRPE